MNASSSIKTFAASAHGVSHVDMNHACTPADKGVRVALKARAAKAANIAQNHTRFPAVSR